jgi:hypothetical protein
MDGFLIDVGVLTIVILIIYIIKKIYDYNYFKRISHIWDNESNQDNIYKAAGVYSSGAPVDDVKSILVNSINFDDEDIDDLLSLLYQHNSAIGGYNFFILAVNKVLGEDIYVTNPERKN